MDRKRLGQWHEWAFEPLPILEALANKRVEYILVGDLAAVLQGCPLPSYTVVIVIAPGAANRKKLIAVLSKFDAKPLTNVPDVFDALEKNVSLSFYTTGGHVDVLSVLPGFVSYSQVHRASSLVELGSQIAVRTLKLRALIHSQIASGDSSYVPAMEATLEIAREYLPAGAS